MIKLELTGPGYLLHVASDPYDGEMHISIVKGTQYADVWLSENQIIQLHAHLAHYMQHRKELGKE